MLPVSSSSGCGLHGQTEARGEMIDTRIGLGRRAWKIAGVLVMELQLGKDGVRGFSVFDQYTPLISVNTAERESARSFTLMHETAHLIARSSASCLSTTLDADDDLERWCDRVAGAVLIPSASLATLVDSPASWLRPRLGAGGGNGVSNEPQSGCGRAGTLG